MISRLLSKSISKLLKKGKVWVLYGARLVGKTCLVKEFLSGYRGRIFSGQGEDIVLRELIESMSAERYRQSFAGYELVFIDEAQRIRQIGEALKLLVDALPELNVIATGSSSFDPSQELGEPLTGRKAVSLLYPLSVAELHAHWGGMKLEQHLDDLLVYGSYPEVLTAGNHDERVEFLLRLREDYLCKDVLELDRLRNARKILDLLRLVAGQVGKEVSLPELGRQLGLNKKTVDRYLDLLGQAFVLVRVEGFSRNLRKEITKSSRYFFVDNGIRNAVLQNFRPLALREDVGALWENFFIMERLKLHHYAGRYVQGYFWRTYDQQEIDWIEEEEGVLRAFECKFRARSVRVPGAWSKAYPNASYEQITRDNYLKYLLPD